MTDYNLHQIVSFELNLNFKTQYEIYGDSSLIDLIMYRMKESTVASQI